MKTCSRRLVALIVTVVACTCTRANAFEVTFDSGAGALTIVDNDVNDLEAESGIIDFDLTGAPVGGIFSAKGRVAESLGSINQDLSIGATPPATETILQNVGGTAASFSVVIRSSSFTMVNPALGWSLYYYGIADDPSGGDVEITAHTIDLYTDTTELRSSLTVPSISPPVAAVDQPVSFEAPVGRASDAAGDATLSHVVLSFTAGPNDELRLADGDSLFADVFEQSRKCVDRMTASERLLTDRARRSDESCVRAGTHTGADVTACADDPLERGAESGEAKILLQFDAYCSPLPAWGVNGASCCENSSNDGASCVMDGDCPGGTCRPGACASAATESSVNAFVHDLFGASVVSATGLAGLCQKSVQSYAGRILSKRWDELRRCIRINVASITDSASLASTCLGPPQPDPHSSLLRSQQSLDHFIQYRCINQGVTPVGASFPGACTGAADVDFGDCVGARIACRFCGAVNVTHDLSPAVDCDLFDNGVADASCP